jgi:hypothetical protein
MEFKQFNKALQAHVTSLVKDETHLFVVEVDKDAMWNLYLDSFPPGANVVYRERREFDCSCCRHFVKAFGNVVAIKDNAVVTIWDFDSGDAKYQPVLDALSAFIKSKPITDVFVTDTRSFGTEKSHEEVDGKVHTWDHFHADLHKGMVVYSDLNAKRGELRDVRNVFQRSLEEITRDAIEAVLDLIAQKSLYKGEEWESVLKQFLKLHKEYHKIPDARPLLLGDVLSWGNLYCWKKSLEVGPVIGKIKNHSIGVLLTNISEGMDLDEAVKKYEQIVAPTNYKRPKAIFTKKMVEEAQKKIQELGLEPSLERRYAALDDITVNNVLFANRNAKKRMAGNVFDDLAGETSAVKPKTFDKLEEVPVDIFIKDILPQATSVEMFLENKHLGNMVSLIAPKNADSKTMFKWNNNFSWAYKGNITDSMKERVKAAGGKVDGVLRFSICWNEDGQNQNDFDAHCKEPDGNEIYFGNRLPFVHRSSGRLDVDIIYPGQNVAVENITWTNRSKMQKGTYLFYVHNFSHHGGRSGFTAEIEFDGQIFSFSYDKELRQSEVVPVAEVELLPSGEFKIREKLPSNVSSRDLWGLKSNRFHPVSVCMYSPNYWDAQDGIGHRHYFFMLKDCVNDESPNGFFNEFLREEFMAHKRVFEALGAKMKVEDSDTQLSGLGFSATKHESFVCRVEGAFKRTLKVII